MRGKTYLRNAAVRPQTVIPSFEIPVKKFPSVTTIHYIQVILQDELIVGSVGIRRICEVVKKEHKHEKRFLLRRRSPRTFSTSLRPGRRDHVRVFGTPFFFPFLSSSFETATELHAGPH
jgi:hypothetical protein